MYTIYLEKGMDDKDKQVEQELVEVQDNMKLMLKNRADDYEYARELLYASAERLQDILDSAVTLAQESEHPRAVEVATNTAASLADVAGKMMDHHLRTEKLNNPKGEKNQVTNNNLNVKLNTSDLLELLNRE